MRNEDSERLVFLCVYILELKNLKHTKKARDRFISQDDSLFCIYMIEFYGDNYDAMSLDPRNAYQLTPSQINRLINVFRRSKYFPQYLEDKKNDKLSVLELF